MVRMGCDMCSSENDSHLVKVEGTLMKVCGSCKQYGEEIRERPKTRPIRRKEQPLILVMEDYATRIKKAREQRDMTQEQLAKQLRIKESQLHKFESDIHKPDLATARLLETQLRITLTEEAEETSTTVTSTKSGPMTIGDLLKQ